MSACNHAIYSARSTIESLFSFKTVVGLGSTFPFNLSSREETQIPVATPPISCSRAKFCPNSSSSGSLPSASSPVSPRLLRRPSKSRLYKGIGLGYPTSKGAPLDEVAMPASRCGGVSDIGVFTMKSGGKVASSMRASGSDLERYTGLGLGAPPTKSRGVTRGDLGASPRRNESNAIPDVPSTLPAELRRISPTNSVTKRHSCKDPAGLAFGHPASIIPHTPSPPPPSQPSGMGMLTSSLSISSELCRLTSQSSPQPPRRSQPQPRARARRLFSSKMAFVTLSKFSKRSLYTIPESSTGSPDQDHSSFIRRERWCRDGKAFLGRAVPSFGQTLF